MGWRGTFVLNLENDLIASLFICKKKIDPLCSYYITIKTGSPKKIPWGLAKQSPSELRAYSQSDIKVRLKDTQDTKMMEGLLENVVLNQSFLDWYVKSCVVMLFLLFRISDWKRNKGPTCHCLWGRVGEIPAGPQCRQCECEAPGSCKYRRNNTALQNVVWTFWCFVRGSIPGQGTDLYQSWICRVASNVKTLLSLQERCVHIGKQLTAWNLCSEFTFWPTNGVKIQLIIT